MAKKKYDNKSIATWIAMIIGLIISIGIGGLFIDGSFLNVMLLKFLPLTVHQIIGGSIVVGAILSFVLNLFK